MSLLACWGCADAENISKVIKAVRAVIEVREVSLAREAIEVSAVIEVSLAREVSAVIEEAAAVSAVMGVGIFMVGIINHLDNKTLIDHTKKWCG